MAIISIVYIVLFAPLLAEAIIYPGIIQNKLQIHPSIFVLCATIVSVIIRLRCSRETWNQLGRVGLYFLAPAATILAVILRAIELLTFSNYVFTHFHIDPVQTGFIGMSLYIVSLPFTDTKLIKEEGEKLILTLSLFLYHIIFIYWISPTIYHYLQGEDGLVEYATFLVFLLSSLITFYSLKFVKQLPFKGNWRSILQLVFIGFALFWFVIAGEEISWGQRILGIDTPEKIRDVNTQGELNLHNNAFLFSYVYFGYFLANVYGLVSWLVYKVLKEKLQGFWNLTLRLMTSRWYLLFLFLPNLVYVVLRFMYGNAVIDESEELSELYLALAVMIVSYSNLLYLKKYLRSNK